MRIAVVSHGGVPNMERVYVRTQLSDHKGHFVRHQAADEMHVATEPVQLRHAYRTSPTPRLCQRSGKLWPTLKGVTAFACFDFDERADKVEAFSFRKAAQGFLLCLKPQPRAALL
jgi:hypothetical protein